MAQERFADVVERFTSGFHGAAAAVSPEVAKQWQEELDRNVRRMSNLARLATAAEPKTGQTPRQEVYKRNKSRLYRYASSRTHRTPILFVIVILIVAFVYCTDRFGFEPIQRRLQRHYGGR